MMVSSLPSMGGTNARPPVAIKMFLACTTIALPMNNNIVWGVNPFSS